MPEERLDAARISGRMRISLAPDGMQIVMEAEMGRPRKVQAQPEPPEESEWDRMVGFLQTLVIVGACGLGVTVAIGLRGIFSVEGGFTGWLAPLVFALVLTTILAGLWHATINMVGQIDAKDMKQVWTAVGFALLLTTFHGATSVPFLASAIGGGEAIRRHQERALGTLSEAADQIAATTKYRETLRAGLTRQKDVLGQFLGAEIAGEGASRAVGFGPKAREVEAAIDALTRSLREIQGSSSAFEADLLTARSEIDLARREALIGDSARFADHHGRARTILSKLSTDAGGLPTLGFDFAGSSIAGVRDVGAELNLLLQDTRQTSGPIRLPAYAPISKPVAVLTYPDVVPLAWSVAIAADFLPLAVILLLIIMRRTDPTERARRKA